MLRQTESFIQSALAHFDSTVADLKQRAVWTNAIEQALRRVYFGVVVTDGPLRSSDGQFDQPLLNRLVRLADSGVFVFVATADGQLPASFPQPPHRLIPLTTEPDQIVVRLRREGLRLDRILRICQMSDDTILTLFGVLERLDPPVSRPKYVPPAFIVALPDDDHNHLPMFKATDEKFVWAAATDQGTFPAAEDVLPIVSDKQALSASEATARLLDGALLAYRVNIAETAAAIDTKDPYPPILRQFAGVRDAAKANMGRNTDVLKSLLQSGLADQSCVSLFDSRSGAVYFLPDEWRDLTAAPPSSLSKELVRYFNDRLPNFWQPDRPCMRHILFTPTKVLLRGEQYYANMRNVSPFERLTMLWDECDELRTVWSRITEHLTLADFRDRKLTIAFLDQLRNIALQTLSFVHAGPPLFGESADPSLKNDFQELFGDERNGVHKLARCATEAYYGFLLGCDDVARSGARDAFEAWSAVGRELRKLSTRAQGAIEKRPMSVGSLVRRWREADHPGENLMTAIAAAAADLPELVTAVGIGWGGIELPLVFRFVRRQCYKKTTDACLIARWSHYRKDSPTPEWDAFPGTHTDLGILQGATAVLFDDNTLTGITLERIRDELLLLGVAEVKMFVVRYSGERREYQMRMTDHGAVDPTLLLERKIDGFLGETPFARSWSTKQYENPIGVFSLSRRRILECIHSNSTVYLYDREGF